MNKVYNFSKKVYWYILNTLFCIGCWVYIDSSYATEVYPSQCKPIVVQHNVLDLRVLLPSMLMIHNLSHNEVWMTYRVNDENKLSESRRIRSNKWSALAIKTGHFVIHCIESIPGHEQNIACARVLAACIWSPLTLPEGVKQTVWAGEDRSLSSLIAYMQRQGFSWS